MGVSEASVIATELERVESKIPVLFERDDTFFSQIEKRPGEVVSSIAMRMPLEIHPGGISGHYNSDGGDLGLGSMPDYDKALINTVELIHRLQWNTRRKWATDSARKAVVNTFRRDLASGMKEFRRFNDSLCMTAGNGVLATATVVTANTPAGSDTATFTTDGFGVRLLRYGGKYNIWNAALTVLRTAAEVTLTFYDGPNKTAQFTPNTAGFVTTDVIVAQGLQTAPPVSILGVPYHANNAAVGTWLGFNRATTPEIRANRVQAGGGLALAQARLALNKVGDRLGSSAMRRIQAWMHPAQAAAYEELAQEVMVINKTTREEGVDLYFSDALRLAGAPVKRHFSWDKTRIDFIDLDAYGRVEFYPVQWYKDENGNRYFVLRGISGGIAASNLAYIVASWNLYVNNPAAIAYIDGLTVPNGY